MGAEGWVWTRAVAYQRSAAAKRALGSTPASCRRHALQARRLSRRGDNGAAMVLRKSRVLPWGILAVAALLRLAWLPLRPPHSDEGVDGWFAEKVLSDGFYHYDPENYHGPLH